MELLHALLSFLEDYRHVALFIGMIVGGESIFLPAVYLTVLGIFEVAPLLLIAGLATIISDTAWYFVGWLLPFERIQNFSFLARRRELISKFTERFDRHRLKLLYLSKFIYGTRTFAQILAGARRVPFFQYFIVNLSGVFSLLIFFTVIGFAVGSSVGAIENAVRRAELLLLLFILIFAIIQIWIKWFIRTRWFRS